MSETNLKNENMEQIIIKNIIEKMKDSKFDIYKLKKEDKNPSNNNKISEILNQLIEINPITFIKLFQLKLLVKNDKYDETINKILEITAWNYNENNKQIIDEIINSNFNNQNKKDIYTEFINSLILLRDNIYIIKILKNNLEWVLIVDLMISYINNIVNENSNVNENQFDSSNVNKSSIVNENQLDSSNKNEINNESSILNENQPKSSTRNKNGGTKKIIQKKRKIIKK
jgi:hypothetical protein